MTCFVATWHAAPSARVVEGARKRPGTSPEAFVRGPFAGRTRYNALCLANGRRNDLVLSMITYAHSAWLTEWRFRRGLKALGTDYADVLLLGYFSKPPSKRILEGARKLVRLGMVRHLGITSHKRTVSSKLEETADYGVYHLRYNATHRGAEEDVFPHLGSAERTGNLDPAERAGIVSFTATDWKRLLQAKRMPPGEAPATAADCYRFVLSNPSVDVCMMGASDLAQMRENLQVLDQGPMDADELGRMRRIGDHLYGR